jgi:hypothetical protein
LGGCNIVRKWLRAVEMDDVMGQVELWSARKSQRRACTMRNPFPPERLDPLILALLLVLVAVAVVASLLR